MLTAVIKTYTSWITDRLSLSAFWNHANPLVWITSKLQKRTFQKSMQIKARSQLCADSRATCSSLGPSHQQQHLVNCSSTGSAMGRTWSQRTPAWPALQHRVSCAQHGALPAKRNNWEVGVVLFYALPGAVYLLKSQLGCRDGVHSQLLLNTSLLQFILVLPIL